MYGYLFFLTLLDVVTLVTGYTTSVLTLLAYCVLFVSTHAGTPAFGDVHKYHIIKFTPMRRGGIPAA